MASSSTRRASATGTTGRASNVKAGNIEQNLCTSSGSSHSINMYPPQSPTRMTNDSILKLAGAFQGLKTSRIRFCACSYSAGEPWGRSFQVIMYFIVDLLFLIADGKSHRLQRTSATSHGK